MGALHKRYRTLISRSLLRGLLWGLIRKFPAVQPLTDFTNVIAPLPIVNSSDLPAKPAAEVADARRHLLGLPLEDLQSWLTENGEKPFRGKQILGWVFQRRASTFAQMTDLPAKLRDKLAENFVIFRSEIREAQVSSDGTDKLLVGLAGGGEVECVLLRDGPRRSICVSSQVGCAMGCVFCASGLDGVERNLTAGEIIEQMLSLQHRLADDERLSHIVMMGMGEPLANLPNVLVALENARSETGLGISPRRITISTVGLPPAIDRLSQNGVPYNLAVSLHAPNDQLRDQLVPVNHKIGIQAILEAADRYFETSGRRLTFEYVLLGGVNDSRECADELVNILRHRAVLLNVIPYNPVEGLPYTTPSQSTISRFRETLEQGGVNVQFRQKKGNEIDAACGQLRRNRK